MTEHTGGGPTERTDGQLAEGRKRAEGRMDRQDDDAGNARSSSFLNEGGGDPLHSPSCAQCPDARRCPERLRSPDARRPKMKMPAAPVRVARPRRAMRRCRMAMPRSRRAPSHAEEQQALQACPDVGEGLRFLLACLRESQGQALRLLRCMLEPRAMIDELSHCHPGQGHCLGLR